VVACQQPVQQPGRERRPVALAVDSEALAVESVALALESAALA
jgi:hypothetical protein